MFIRSFALCCVCLSLISAGSISSELTATEPLAARPNILFIAIDDLRPELGTYGAKTITPNLDKLAASGVRFDRAYCQQAVCGASRLSIMGGLYPTATQEQTFHVSGWRDRHPNLLTMNQHFVANGYETIGLGKIYHGTGGNGVDRANWNRWIDIAGNHYAKRESLEALRRALGEGRFKDTKDRAKGPLTESAEVDDDTYLDGQRAARSIEILKEFASNPSKPFFLAVGFTKPHLPFVAPKKYWDLYQRDDFAMPSNLSIPPGYPVHAANQMAHEMQKYSDFEGESPKDFSDDLNKRLLHGYAAATSYVDACVGRVLDSLQQSGLAENTVVVLWGDHGWKLGDHSTWVKHTNFECDTRVPLIVRDPRINTAQPTSRLVELIDLYPTLCDLSGIPTPSHCQGRSFQKLLSDPEAGHRNEAYSSYPAYKMLGHSIRISNYRYTQWLDKAGTVKAKVLTNLKADPGEVTNVIDDPKHAKALAKAVERLEFRVRAAASANRKGDMARDDPSPKTITKQPVIKIKSVNAQRVTNYLMTQIKSAELTDSQKESVATIAEEGSAAMIAVYQDAGVTDQLITKRRKEMQSLAGSIKNYRSRAAAADKAVGISKEQTEAFNQVNSLRSGMLKDAIGLLTSEQTAKLPAKMQQLAK